MALVGNRAQNGPFEELCSRRRNRKQSNRCQRQNGKTWPCQVHSQLPLDRNKCYPVLQFVSITTCRKVKEKSWSGNTTERARYPLSSQPANRSGRLPTFPLARLA